MQKTTPDKRKRQRLEIINDLYLDQCPDRLTRRDYSFKMKRKWRKLDTWLASTVTFHAGFLHGAAQERGDTGDLTHSEMLDRVSFYWDREYGRLYLNAEFECPEFFEGRALISNQHRERRHKVIQSDAEDVFYPDATHPNSPFVELIREVQRTVDRMFGADCWSGPFIECASDNCYAVLIDPDEGQICHACKQERRAERRARERAMAQAKNETSDTELSEEEKERRKMTQSLRFDVFNRDDFTCQACGRTPEDDDVTLHADHIKPIAKGGKTEMDNLQALCADCNYGKSDKRVEQMESEEATQ